MGAGELAAEIAVRQDTEQYRNGAKSLNNRRCLIGGGTKRRPGSWWLQDLPGPSRLRDWIVDQSTEYVVAVGDGRFNAYLPDGTPAGGIAVCPWIGDLWRTMQMTQSGNTMFLTHVDMPTQVISRTGAATWAVLPYAFYVGPAGRPEQPYLKFAAPSVTLQPSALTGATILTASAAVFTPAHVNQYIRYQDKAIRVTSYTDPTHVNGTVIENLPGTQRLTVTASASFAISEIVQGGTSAAKGQITAIPDATHVDVVVIEKLTKFTVENLIGPNAVTAISAVADIANAAVTNWDEQMFGAVYGYPGASELHRNRLLFAAHKTAPDFLAGSTINNLYNFNVGTGADADGFLESIGDAGASRIVQLHSAEQLLVMTDRGPYYIPEGQGNPFRPSSLAFFPFGSLWPITSTVRAQSFDNGVVMVSNSLVIKARPTGDLSRAWDADEVSLLAPHLIKSPIYMGVTSNFGGGPERYAMFVNSDGTLGVMQLVEGQKIRNFTPWDTNGSIQSIAALQDKVYIATTRSIAGDTRYILELFDQDITLDAATSYADLTALAGSTSRYGNTALNVVAGQFHLGTLPLSIPSPPVGPYIAGLYYTSQIELLPPVIESQEGSQTGEFMRIYEALVNVHTSARFTTNGQTLQAYQVTDDLDDPPPLLTGWQRFQFFGWKRSPTILITQADPLPLDVLGVKTSVAHA